MPLIHLALHLSLREPTAEKDTRAEELLRLALRASPRTPKVLLNLGHFLHTRGRHAEAAEHLGRAARIDPADPHVRALLQQAQAALK